MSSGSSNLLEVPAGNLQAGMFVSALDRPWLETPFSVQGFYIRDTADAQLVARHCAYVFVDPRRRSRAPLPAKQAFAATVYKEKTSLKREFRMAKIELESATEAMRKVLSNSRAVAI